MNDGKIVPFNPLGKRQLGESVGQAMLRQRVIPLADRKRSPPCRSFSMTGAQ